MTHAKAARRFDPRGLVELDESVPRIAEIDGERATFDARSLTTRQINLECVASSTRRASRT